LPKASGVNYLDAVRAFEKAGFRIARQSKHIVMTMANEFSPFLATIQSTRSRWAVSSATLVSPSNNSASYS